MTQNNPLRRATALAAATGGPAAARKKGQKAGQKKKGQARRKLARTGVPFGAVTLDSVPLIYLNVPKSACTTIKNQLYFMEHGHYIDEPLDIHAHDGLQRSRERTDETLQLFDGKLGQPHMVFTFVRHPGKRAYSCFSEKIFHQSKYSFPKIRDYITAQYGLKLPEGDAAAYDLLAHRANFSCFLDFVQANFDDKTEIRVDAHWGRQTSIIEHFQRYFVIDFIGRVESFERQFNFVLDQLPLPYRPDLSVRFNEGPKPPFSYEQVADASIETRLREIYADDYKLLGYASDAI